MTRAINAVRKVEKKFVGELKKSSVGRSLAKVIEPLLNGKSKVDDAIGKFGRSKVGKLVVTAVAIYFGGAALAGAMGGGAAAATGASGWAGAAQGLSGAWTGVAQAGSAVAAGEFSAAGSALSTGAAGGSAAGATVPTAAGMAPDALNAVTTIAPEVGKATASQAANGALQSSGQLSAVTLPSVPTTTATVAPAGEPGMLSNFFSNPRNTPALLQAGSGMLGSLAQSNQQKAMYQLENEKQEDMRRRYGVNNGTRLWGT